MKLNLYQKTAIVTVIATLFLIFVGGLVRAAGAGLGCPDWPKCFGTWIPPTTAEALPSAFDESQFNVWKTWIEYINRLIGVLIGFLITATFGLSFRYRKSKPSVFISSGIAFVLVLVQAWLGGQVVRSGLSEWMITLHMMLAMIIVNILLFAAFQATSDLVKISVGEEFRKKVITITGVLLVLTFVQMVLGTQVREGIDLIKEAPVVPPRGTWIDQLGSIFPVHRSFSWALVIGGGVLFWFLRKFEAEGIVRTLGLANVGLILLQVLIGAGLYYLDMPKVLQVLHLVGISFMICGQFLLILILGKSTDIQHESSHLKAVPADR